MLGPAGNHALLVGPPVVLSPSIPRLRRGLGYLAGTYPNGITKIEGVPGVATIRVLHRPLSGAFGDGMVVREVKSSITGEWLVTDLDATLRYDVVCRHDGYNDSIYSNVSPATV